MGVVIVLGFVIIQMVHGSMIVKLHGKQPSFLPRAVILQGK